MSVVIHKYVTEHYSQDDESLRVHGSSVIRITDIDDFGTVKLNTDFISEIYESKHLSINVSEKVLDDFLCTFFKNRICLVEKKISDKIIIRTIEKKYHSPCVVTSFVNYFLEDNGMEKFYLFKHIHYSYIIMNNNSKIMVLK